MANYELARDIVNRYFDRVQAGKSAGDSLTHKSKTRIERAKTHSDKLREQSLNDILAQFNDTPLYLHPDNPLREQWFRIGSELRSNHKF